MELFAATWGTFRVKGAVVGLSAWWGYWLGGGFGGTRAPGISVRWPGRGRRSRYM